MTQTALRLKTRVLPGKRVEFTAPELTEGEEVEVFVALPERAGEPAARQFASAAEYLDSLPTLQRTPEEWARINEEFQLERDSWDAADVSDEWSDEDLRDFSQTGWELIDRRLEADGGDAKSVRMTFLRSRYRPPKIADDPED